jgi:hypothetical protein
MVGMVALFNDSQGRNIQDLFFQTLVAADRALALLVA